MSAFAPKQGHSQTVRKRPISSLSATRPSLGRLGGVRYIPKADVKRIVVLVGLTALFETPGVTPVD
ncbi:hypothetical protein GCM10009096_19120 [Parasphingorhabdus litoris]|uniref:Uncharacterized protein n=1 Tax=Parasphingorhabdus litoris TaxID=394733 RepID=A0ABN1AIJ0_9SPHN